ncbi:hypothetical protein GWK48_01280 [Metallosphaera tengchongensis]|uniref:Uncharacterized protein n=1 Tax=Metallosphaera tengchongensis TaxID=1532350 RepID=A0A6N0NZZ1_9CREN|nr:hypothetical protein GWK48_01280 [Metallosphaera tengchongensis]
MVLVLVLVAVALTLSVSLIGFSLFRNYGAQNIIAVRGEPSIVSQGGKYILNLTLQNQGTTTILIESVSIGANVVNTTVFSLPGGSIQTLHIYLNVGYLPSNTDIQVAIKTSSQLEPVFYTYAVVS